MMGIVKGLTVVLHEKVEAGADDYGQTTYTENLVAVDNVFIQNVSDDAIVSNIDVAGKHNSFVLHIPIGDNHKWEDSLVDLPAPYNITVKTYASGMIFREDLVPLEWNKQIKAEIYG